jgi:hypothetical protein
MRRDSPITRLARSLGNRVNDFSGIFTAAGSNLPPLSDWLRTRPGAQPSRAKFSCVPIIPALKDHGHDGKWQPIWKPQINPDKFT